ncbi:uncharacterized protein N7469_000817 [Penicillium citrinum]|uniref:Yeast cell wall synthesis Kre9/Knh1-like N-terminal domain-containing protein n=1 Tax=Penicillium citrinum TaxID=5077 RepID=A0A9W9PDM8_PENCI|nr:uncharacterized protein N7469_000817 [Penicillium citrinum]KAJ5242490.1 hypothetical protein N7469_000817 [Penicillium citrinum]
MHFITVTSLFAALAAAASTNNDFNNPKGGYSFTAGESTTLTWDHKSGSTVSLRLQSGSVTTANSGTAIASNIDNTGSFTWNVPTDLVKGREYTVEIINDSNPDDYNFLPYFTVAGATGGASATSAPSTTSTSAAETSTTEEATTTTTTTTADATTTTEASTTATTSSSATKTTATTLTKASSTATTTSSTPSTTASSSTSTSSSSTESSSSSPSSSASASSTAVPNTNGSVANRVSAGMLALVAGVIAMM